MFCAPGDRGAGDLAVRMLPGRDAHLNLVHRLEGDDVRGCVAVGGEPLLLLLFGPDLLVHDGCPRLDCGHRRSTSLSPPYRFHREKP